MTKIYTYQDIDEILTACLSYLQGETDEQTKIGYFLELVNTGLFEDAVGKVLQRGTFAVEVTENYYTTDLGWSDHLPKS